MAFSVHRGHLQSGGPYKLRSFPLLYRGACPLFGVGPCGPSRAQACPQWRGQEGRVKVMDMQGQTAAMGELHAGRCGGPLVGWGSRDHPPVTRAGFCMPPPAPYPQHSVCSRERHQDLLGDKEALLWAGGWGSRGSGSGGQQRRIGPRPGRRRQGWSGRACRAPRERPGKPRSISAWRREDTEQPRRCWRDARREGSGRETGGQGQSGRARVGGGLRGAPPPHAGGWGEADQPLWAAAALPSHSCSHCGPSPKASC